MSGFRGTPGPWVRHEPSGYQHSMGGYILGRQGKICDVSGFDVGSDAAKENGKLIAAAPELLEALQDAEKALFAALDNAFGEELANGNRELIQARAAIARALGQ